MEYPRVDIGVVCFVVNGCTIVALCVGCTIVALCV